MPALNALSQEWLTNLDLRVLAVQRVEAGRWWNFAHVVSPFSRLWLILDGRATVHHHGRQFDLIPGKVHLVPPFARHDCSCQRRFDHYYLHFVSRMQTGVDLLSLLDLEFELPATPDLLKQFQRLETIYPNRKLPCFDPSREEYRRQSLAVEQEDREMPAVDWFEAQGILTSLLAPFLRKADGHTGVHARATRQFLAVQEFIHANMHRPIQLADLAIAARLHPTYFSDRFKELVGVRPLEYLMRRRMERAQYLLLTTPSPVKEVAANVGIADAAYFSRVFTSHCGRSPSDYRATHSH